MDPMGIHIFIAILGFFRLFKQSQVKSAVHIWAIGL